MRTHRPTAGITHAMTIHRNISFQISISILSAKLQTINSCELNASSFRKRQTQALPVSHLLPSVHRTLSYWGQRRAAASKRPQEPWGVVWLFPPQGSAANSCHQTSETPRFTTLWQHFVYLHVFFEKRFTLAAHVSCLGSPTPGWKELGDVDSAVSSASRQIKEKLHGYSGRPQQKVSLFRIRSALSVGYIRAILGQFHNRALVRSQYWCADDELG